jgi:tetratricopeptide (TPR) repeat protein
VHAAIGLMNLGLVAYRQERFSEAKSLFLESVGIFDELGDRNIGASVHVNLGIVLQVTGELDEAAAAYEKAVVLSRATGAMENVASCLEGFSGIALRRDDIPRAARLAGAAESMRKRFEMARHTVDQRQWDTEYRAPAAKLGEEEFRRCWAEGEALEWEAAVALALGESDPHA